MSHVLIFSQFIIEMVEADNERRLVLTGLMRDILVELQGYRRISMIYGRPTRPNIQGQKD